MPPIANPPPESNRGWPKHLYADLSPEEVVLLTRPGHNTTTAPSGNGERQGIFSPVYVRLGGSLCPIPKEVMMSWVSQSKGLYHRGSVGFNSALDMDTKMDAVEPRATLIGPRSSHFLSNKLSDPRFS